MGRTDGDALTDQIGEGKGRPREGGWAERRHAGEKGIRIWGNGAPPAESVFECVFSLKACYCSKTDLIGDLAGDLTKDIVAKTLYYCSKTYN
jgi:hypothetical protein